MNATTQARGYTLNIGGCAWVFKPDAVESMTAAGWSTMGTAILLPVILSAGIEGGLKAGTVYDVKVAEGCRLRVTRHGRKVTVEAQAPPGKRS